MNAPKSVMFLTTPSRTCPTSNSLTRVSRFFSRSPSRITLRDTTMLRRRLFSLMILNSNIWPNRSSMFGTRRRAICEPGRNASTPMISTVTPPLILRVSMPSTGSSASWASRIFSQTRRKSAFFLESTTMPSSSSRLSRRTSTSCPGSIPSRSLNSSRATAPSLLNPNSRMTMVSVTRRTFALTISPSRKSPMVMACSESKASKSAEEMSSSSSP